MSELLNSYVCAVAQQSMRPVYKTADGSYRPECATENLDRVLGLVERAVKDHQAKLVAFPEFCVQGYVAGRSVADWERAGVTLPGPETAAMAKLAKALDVHIAGAVYERIPEFPGRYFMSGFMVAPDGATPEAQLKLRYRKAYALTHKTRPGDMYDQYVARYGHAALFPVAATRLGKIGCAVAADIAWPEVTRTLAMKGAELIFNPTAVARAPGYASESEDPDQPVAPAMPMVRRVRAWENLVYLAMANIGPFYDDDGRAGTARRLPSEIVDFQGRILARAETDQETLVPAVIDMQALRRYRATQPRFNYLAQLQPQLHVPDYSAAALCPLNGFARPHKDDAEAVAFIQGVCDRMAS
jgi:predicted amidohydrolase